MDRYLSKEDALQLLKRNNTGIISMITKEENPYGVSVNYVYDEETNALYFHSKPIGKKIESIERNSHVSFLVFDNNNVVADAYVTHYQSAIVTGNAEVIKEEQAKIKYLKKLCLHTVPERMDRFDNVVSNYIKGMVMVKISVTEITGKQNRDD